MDAPNIGLRERTRRAIRKEITEAASALFLAKGFTATTIDEIAAVVGMSPRSLFRYFPTKEDIVLAKLDLAAEEMLDILAERPAGEPVWQSLRTMFAPFAAYDAEAEKRLVAEPIQRVVFDTPALLARYLHKLDDLQGAVVAILLEREADRGGSFSPSSPAPRAIVAAAFGCLVAAQRTWLAGHAASDMARMIDSAMEAVLPLRSRA